MGEFSDYMSYDPWSNVKTRNGFSGDEIISMLQKSIRRGLVEDAIKAAYEMYITSPQFEEKLWRRLQMISIEDIGFGEPFAPIYVRTLNQMRQDTIYADGDRPFYFIQAIRYMCKCHKDRSTDYYYNKVKVDFKHGDTLTVPDYALDMHTKRGRDMGRDITYFVKEASRVESELDSEEVREAREKFGKLCTEEMDQMTGEPDVQPFTYNTWQY